MKWGLVELLPGNILQVPHSKWSFVLIADHTRLILPTTAAKSKRVRITLETLLLARRNQIVQPLFLQRKTCKCRRVNPGDLETRWQMKVPGILEIFYLTTSAI